MIKSRLSCDVIGPPQPAASPAGDQGSREQKQRQQKAKETEEKLRKSCVSGGAAFSTAESSRPQMQRMLQRTSAQLLLLTALCAALFCRTLSLPYAASIRLSSVDGDNENWTKTPSIQDSLPETYKLYYDLSNAVQRPTRHADGLFTSGYSKLLGQLSARRYLESLIGKRVSDDFMEDQAPIKRHSDAIFTDNYSRFRKQMAVKKYLNSVLTGKRSQEDPPAMQEESTRSEPSFPESFDDVTVDELLHHLPLTL
ncbi:VIP peptides-like [Arapaima gigas]